MTYGTAGVLNIICGEQPQRVAGLTPSMAWGVQGTVAYEFTGELQQSARASSPKADAKTLNVRKPSGGHAGH